PRRAALDQAEPRDRGDVAHPQHVTDAVAAAPVDHPVDPPIVAALAVVATLGLRGARIPAVAPVVVAGPAGTLVALAGIAAVRLRAIRIAAIRIAPIGRAIPAIGIHRRRHRGAAVAPIAPVGVALAATLSPTLTPSLVVAAALVGRRRRFAAALAVALALSLPLRDGRAADQRDGPHGGCDLSRRR